MRQIGIHLFLLLFTFKCFAEVTVCTSGCMYSELQSAVNNVQPNTKIILKNGIYNNQAIIINKPLIIEGEGLPELQGNGAKDIILVKSSDVKINGLKIAHTGNSYLQELAGIRVEDSSSVTISDNTFFDNAYGVYLANSESCTVENNFVQGTYKTESESGNGIHSWSGKQHVIRANIINGHRDGIYLEFTNDSKITNNQVKNNVRYGLHFMTSHRNLYQENRFEENGAGVAVMYSREVSMINNVFANNRGTAAYGLLLKDISAGKILYNIFSDNTYGVYMEGTNRTSFSSNKFRDNGYGLRIFGDCDDNQFNKNDFNGNTFDVVTNSSRNPNNFTGNYWSQYQGYDLDKNGIGDVPYRPVSLSSVIVEKLDSSYVLIKSPLLLLLDQIEQSFPLLIPESLKDESPLMNSANGAE